MTKTTTTTTTTMTMTTTTSKQKSSTRTISVILRKMSTIPLCLNIQGSVKRRDGDRGKGEKTRRRWQIKISLTSWSSLSVNFQVSTHHSKYRQRHKWTTKRVHTEWNAEERPEKTHQRHIGIAVWISMSLQEEKCARSRLGWGGG